MKMIIACFRCFMISELNYGPISFAFVTWTHRSKMCRGFHCLLQSGHPAAPNIAFIELTARVVLGQAISLAEVLFSQVSRVKQVVCTPAGSGLVVCPVPFRAWRANQFYAASEQCLLLFPITGHAVQAGRII